MEDRCRGCSMPTEITTIRTPNNLPVRLDAEFVNATDLWKADGSDPSKRPNTWLTHETTQNFQGYLETAIPGCSFVRTVEGRNGGTWVHWQLALAYAKYLSPEFHAWCNTVVRDHMQGSSTLTAHEPAFTLILDELRTSREQTNLILQQVLSAVTSSFINQEQRSILRSLAKAISPKNQSKVWADVRAKHGYGSGNLFATVPAEDYELVKAELKAQHKKEAVPHLSNDLPKITSNRYADLKKDMSNTMVVERLKRDLNNILVTPAGLSAQDGVYDLFSIPALLVKGNAEQPGRYLDDSRYAHLLFYCKTRRSDAERVSRLADNFHRLSLHHRRNPA